MRRLATTMLAVFVLAGPLARPAAAVSIDDLFNLRAHGLSDDVLVALIETDGSVFHLTPSDVAALHRRGMSDSLLVAMLDADKRASRRPARTGHEGHERTENRRPVPPAAAVVVGQTAVVVNQAPAVVVVPVAVIVPIKPAEPVYWGFGGKPRPGSWKPQTP